MKIPFAMIYLVLTLYICFVSAEKSSEDVVLKRALEEVQAEEVKLETKIEVEEERLLLQSLTSSPSISPTPLREDSESERGSDIFMADGSRPMAVVILAVVLFLGALSLVSIFIGNLVC